VAAVAVCGQAARKAPEIANLPPQEIFFRLAVLSLARNQARHRDWATSDEGRAALQAGTVADPFDVVQNTTSWHLRAARAATQAMKQAALAESEGVPVSALEQDTEHGRIQILPLATPAALVQESALMGHCIGTRSLAHRGQTGALPGLQQTGVGARDTHPTQSKAQPPRLAGHHGEVNRSAGQRHRSNRRLRFARQRGLQRCAIHSGVAPVEGGRTSHLGW
jgi:hypothetical protein